MLTTSHKKRSPLGELAAQRVALGQEYLSKSNELTALRRLDWIQKNVGKLWLASVDIH